MLGRTLVAVYRVDLVRGNRICDYAGPQVNELDTRLRFGKAGTKNNLRPARVLGTRKPVDFKVRLGSV